jgi:MoaA/NifB/PqqE/SkfB family radical SAM enzyme
METGRKYVIQSRIDSEQDRNDFMVQNMDKNKAYLVAAEGLDKNGREKVLQEYVARYVEYRKNWRSAVQRAGQISDREGGVGAPELPLLCANIEVAAICDLACPFCYRQFIATPDKIIEDRLYYQLVDQIAQMKVPSLKFIWRGESLLHPRLDKFVDYAKKSGVIDTMINTNAVTLNDKKSEALIDVGLDHLIYSFDGGTAESYNKMRPGRFRENSFDRVYQNIKRFNEIRDKKGAIFPRTKIQMVLTQETFSEKERFFSLFDEFVDDVSVKAYTERGGSLEELDTGTRARIREYLASHKLPESTPYWRDINGDIYIAKDRLPCEQPFQRLMVSYDGQVSMCCYDWELAHPIGFVDDRSFGDPERDSKEIVDRARSGKKGFEGMAKAHMPRRFFRPKDKVSSLEDIWNGEHIAKIRDHHLDGNAEALSVCRDCVFKEQFRWQKIP